MSSRARIHDTLERLERWLREHQPAFLDAMRPGATDAELDDLERAISRTLPEDVRAFYRWRGGIAAAAYPRPYSPFWDRPLTLDEIRELYQQWRLLADTLWQAPEFGPGWWHPAWVPFMGDEEDGCFCADTAGVWTGVRGQIVEFHVGSDSRRIVAGSLHDWLRVLVTDLERGRGYDSEGHRTDALMRYPLGYTRSQSATEPAVIPEPETPTTTPPVIIDPDVVTPGNRVRITTGAFRETEGELRSVEPGTWTARVTLTFWGRPLDVEIDAATLVLVERSRNPSNAPDRLACDDSDGLLRQLGFRCSVRKLRLLVAACYRTLLETIPEAESLSDAIECAAEAETAIPVMRALAEDFWCDVGLPARAPENFENAIRALTLRTAPTHTFESLAPAMVRWGFGPVDLVREIFPNPFAPPRFDPAWHTSDAVAVARGIYDTRVLEGLPVLADALQEAGCDNDELLNHLRDTSRTHVRGCWALDLCLGLD